jgi:predicted SAM-dependent methyltransferase
MNSICEEKGFDENKLRLNLGSGPIRYSNCINLELEDGPQVDADIFHDITNKLPFEDGIFIEVMFIHVIEHVLRKYHVPIFDEIHRVLKKDGRLILSYPEAIPVMRAFIANDYGARWSMYNDTLYGARRRTGDDHVTAVERHDVSGKLMSCGFIDLKYHLSVINATITAKKGEKLDDYI